MEEYRENNKETLARGLQKLSRYEAPAAVWSELASKLDQQKVMRTALAELPQYPAPAGVWEELEQRLEQTRPRNPIRRLRNNTRVWAAAAALTGIVLCAWWLTKAESPARTTIVYAVETQLQLPVAEDWKAEDDIFEMILQRVDHSPVADDEIVNRLKMEFEELTTARTEVETMLQRYGQDEGLLKEVARIERERSDVIKELATWI